MPSFDSISPPRPASSLRSLIVSASLSEQEIEPAVSNVRGIAQSRPQQVRDIKASTSTSTVPSVLSSTSPPLCNSSSQSDSHRPRLHAFAFGGARRTRTRDRPRSTHHHERSPPPYSLIPLAPELVTCLALSPGVLGVCTRPDEDEQSGGDERGRGVPLAGRGGAVEREAFFADLIVVADGCFSNFRSQVMGKAAIQPMLKNHFVALLSYQLGTHDTRVLVDVKNPVPSELKGHILNNIIP
ncbi:hypothetical protein L226DRAFT_572789 [Lentinus tigrinus ALCF2SS1-7]|uniref:uncharacterized protein n=1 Tax=Lentinus tigrinus ALCF2SS1-7 TaxID=1328758 RepID=UPI0011660AC3|nr:hypothetical protein L226DRAFT_572789 [Lentinus tigrinus ALCF2SS1-7]